VTKNLFISSCLLTLNIFIQGQTVVPTVGAPAAASGYTSLTTTDLWSVFNNQAASASLRKIQAGLFFENLYLLDEMSRVAIGAFLPLGNGGVSISIDQFGSSLYSEMKAGVAYALRMGDHFSAGVQLDYLRMSIGEGYGNYHAISFEAGILALITENLSLGVHVFNPTHQRWMRTEAHIKALIRGGLALRVEKSLEIYGEVHKSTADQAMFCGGAEYRYREKFFLRMGITSGPARYTFGVGLQTRRILLDISSSVHSWLGYSPQLSFTYTFNK